MEIQSFVLESSHAGPALKASMKRYRPSGITHRSPQDPGYILLFGHGIGFHKELWEPTIEHLFELAKNNRGPSRILEAWAIDAQNHGESAPLNDDVFMKFGNTFTIYEYAAAFVQLYKSGLLGEVKKGVQKLVLLGHSAGSVGVISAASSFDPPSAIPFDMVILVDPSLYSPSMRNKMTDMYRYVERSTASRRAVWANREEAHDWLKNRPPWKFWNPRVLELHTKYGLRPLPTPFHPNEKGVILICDPAHESMAFSGADSTVKAIDDMNRICRSVPFHIIFGERNDMFSREAQDSISEPEVGRVIASVHRIKGAGHLVVQEKPEQLASAILEIINAENRTPKL